MQLRHAANTDNGRARDHNEDTFAFDVSAEHADAGALFVICDGMGGFASGEVASDLAVNTITTRYYELDPSDPQSALRTAFHDANERVYREGRGKMGTTGVAALFRNNVVLLANVGDSRAYVIRAGQIRQLTQDHSFVAEQVSAGMLTPEQARESSYRNIITRALGHRGEVEVDIFQFPLRPDDRILLCSDGLHGVVESDELIELAGSGSPKRDVEALIALANERGGPDNITVVLVEVVELGDGPSGGTVRTERMPGRSAGTAQMRTGQSQAASAGTRKQRSVAATAPSSPKPKQVRPSAPPPEPPARRSSIVGMIFVILIALTLVSGLLWFALTTGIATQTFPTTQPAPTLTPPGSGTLTPAPSSPTPVATGNAITPTVSANNQIIVPTVTVAP